MSCIILRDLEQGTPEWLQARMAIPTASNFNKIMTTTGKASSSAGGYMDVLLGEWMSGEPAENKQYQFMTEGTEKEPDARTYYEFECGVSCDQVGLVYSDERKLISGSPDSLVGDDGGLEIKCPIKSTQVKYLRGGKVPTDYLLQVQGNMWVCERQWWDFLSYCPGLPPLLVRVERDEALISRLSASVEVFVQKMLKERELFKEMMSKGVAA